MNKYEQYLNETHTDALIKEYFIDIKKELQDWEGSLYRMCEAKKKLLSDDAEGRLQKLCLDKAIEKLNIVLDIIERDIE